MNIGDNKHYLILKPELYQILKKDHGELPEFIIEGRYLPQETDSFILVNKAFSFNLELEKIIK